MKVAPRAENPCAAKPPRRSAQRHPRPLRGHPGAAARRPARQHSARESRRRTAPLRSCLRKRYLRVTALCAAAHRAHPTLNVRRGGRSYGSPAPGATTLAPTFFASGFSWKPLELEHHHRGRAAPPATSVAELDDGARESRVGARNRDADDPRPKMRAMGPHLPLDRDSANELDLARLVGECIIRQPGLLGQLDPPPAGVAETSDQYGRQQGGIYRVAHRAGHRHVQGFSLQTAPHEL
jgi:hypothetical protein